MIGNPLSEAHGHPMRCYDWIAVPGTDPRALPALIEAAIPGLRLECKTPTDSQNGFLVTRRMPDDSLHVMVCLHGAACATADPACREAHGAHDIEIAPALTAAAEALLAVNEHPGLTLTPDNAHAVLGDADPFSRRAVGT